MHGRAIRHYAFAPTAHSLATLVQLAVACGVATIPSPRTTVRYFEGHSHGRKTNLRKGRANP